MPPGWSEPLLALVSKMHHHWDCFMSVSWLWRLFVTFCSARSWGRKKFLILFFFTFFFFSSVPPVHNNAGRMWRQRTVPETE